MCKFLLYAKAAALLGRCVDFLAYLYVWKKKALPAFGRSEEISFDACQAWQSLKVRLLKASDKLHTLPGTHTLAHTHTNTHILILAHCGGDSCAS